MSYICVMSVVEEVRHVGDRVIRELCSAQFLWEPLKLL